MTKNEKVIAGILVGGAVIGIYMHYQKMKRDKAKVSTTKVIEKSMSGPCDNALLGNDNVPSAPRVRLLVPLTNESIVTLLPLTCSWPEELTDILVPPRFIVLPLK